MNQCFARAGLRFHPQGAFVALFDMVGVDGGLRALDSGVHARSELARNAVSASENGEFDSCFRVVILRIDMTGASLGCGP